MDSRRRGDPVPARELAHLIERYGRPAHEHVEFALSSSSTGPAGFPLSSQRTAEAVLIVPRPGNRVLVHTKHFYPSGIWRLPTGGLHRGEGLEHALLREAKEETGNDLRPLAFLFRIDYRWQGSEKAFDSFGFLMSEATERLESRDPREQITAFRDVDREGIRRVGLKLESLSGTWKQWGLFRAAPHKVLLRLWPEGRALSELVPRSPSPPE